jgi:hypothetical protein
MMVVNDMQDKQRRAPMPHNIDIIVEHSHCIAAIDNLPPQTVWQLKGIDHRHIASAQLS